jgi:hypothetical protein
MSNGSPSSHLPTPMHGTQGRRWRCGVCGQAALRRCPAAIPRFWPYAEMREITLSPATGLVQLLAVATVGVSWTGALIGWRRRSRHGDASDHRRR